MQGVVQRMLEKVSGEDNGKSSYMFLLFNIAFFSVRLAARYSQISKELLLFKAAGEMKLLLFTTEFVCNGGLSRGRVRLRRSARCRHITVMCSPPRVFPDYRRSGTRLGLSEILCRDTPRCQMKAQPADIATRRNRRTQWR